MTLNDRILAAAQALPQGRGYRFRPGPRAGPTDPTNPRDPEHDGVTADLSYAGERVAVAAPDGATYCCGVTFEAWLRAWGEAPIPGCPDGESVRRLVADWFCPTMGHAGVRAALVRRGLGTAVARDEARPGDLCQFWRSTDLAKPSGHSVVFLGWDGDVVRYWSSQPATQGVGVHREVVGPGWEVHLVRAHQG